MPGRLGCRGETPIVSEGLPFLDGPKSRVEYAFRLRAPMWKLLTKGCGSHSRILET